MKANKVKEYDDGTEWYTDDKLNNFKDFLNENIKEFETLKKDDIVKFINKKDSSDIINGKITEIDKVGRRIYFINIDFPDVGMCDMTEYSISKYWNIEK